MTPYEEINELIDKMRTAKETLEGTDIEYFGKEQLVELNKLSNEVAGITLNVMSVLNE